VIKILKRATMLALEMMMLLIWKFYDESRDQRLTRIITN
jgi:hypothetical protein